MVTGLQHSLLHKLYLLFYARRLNAVPMSIVSTEGKIFPCLEKLRGHYPCTCVGTQQKRGQSDTKGTKDHCTSDTRIYAKRKSGTVAPSHIQRPVHLLLIKWFFSAVTHSVLRTTDFSSTFSQCHKLTTGKTSPLAGASAPGGRSSSCTQRWLKMGTASQLPVTSSNSSNQEVLATKGGSREAEGTVVDHKVSQNYPSLTASEGCHCITS